MMTVNAIRVLNYTTTNFVPSGTFPGGIEYTLQFNVSRNDLTLYVPLCVPAGPNVVQRDMIFTAPVNAFQSVTMDKFMDTPLRVPPGIEDKCIDYHYSMDAFDYVNTADSVNCQGSMTPSQCKINEATSTGAGSSSKEYNLIANVRGVAVNGFPVLPANGDLLPVMQFGNSS